MFVEGHMEQQENLTRVRFMTPRAAALAGIIFSILFIVSIVLIRLSVPADPYEAGTWLPGSWKTVGFALNLLPFAGIAFLWFIGVLRHRIGAHEDRLFATVFLGSGILFLSTMFLCAAIAGGLVMIYGAAPDKFMELNIYRFGRTITNQIMQVYAMRMAGVFMMLTSTLSLRTGILPRWMAFLGYGLALLLLMGLGYFSWISLIFPLWVFVISIYILVKGEKTDG
jgi:hypothetical protein